MHLRPLRVDAKVKFVEDKKASFEVPQIIKILFGRGKGTVTYV